MDPDVTGGGIHAVQAERRTGGCLSAPATLGSGAPTHRATALFVAATNFPLDSGDRSGNPARQSGSH
jgi:hypothetical protein